MMNKGIYFPELGFSYYYFDYGYDCGFCFLAITSAIKLS